MPIARRRIFTIECKIRRYDLLTLSHSHTLPPFSHPSCASGARAILPHPYAARSESLAFNAPGHSCLS